MKSVQLLLEGKQQACKLPVYRRQVPLEQVRAESVLNLPRVSQWVEERGLAPAQQEHCTLSL